MTKIKNYIPNFINAYLEGIKDSRLPFKIPIISSMILEVTFIPYIITLCTGKYISVLTIACVVSFILFELTGSVWVIYTLITGNEGFKNEQKETQ